MAPRRSIVLLHALLFTLPALSSCSSQSAPQATSSTSPSSTAPTVVGSQVNAVNSALNSTNQYALTQEDLALLNAKGITSADDQAALSAFVKQ